MEFSVSHMLSIILTISSPHSDSSTGGQEIDIGIEDSFNFNYIYASSNQHDPQHLSTILANKGALKRSRRRRTAFTHSQLAYLERKFRCQKYLSVADRGEVASHLNLSETQGEVVARCTVWGYEIMNYFLNNF